jgi:hypothetical protein
MSSYPSRLAGMMTWWTLWLMLGKCADQSVHGEPSKNIYLYTLARYIPVVYIIYIKQGDREI